ncbi:hypothetical protein G6553_13885 [Nocardioides sp. IC4_145]|uniref:hypothetical protein n=1 Tax=Nocardioides sp. IC4_145 TaxID=2714037 RepID=UPI001407816C|nr:hypothetical protein [Nocardioides sp. IC4_145]NHC24257.1 hypothetical protein [Nocardioides sp. IC4_145]
MLLVGIWLTAVGACDLLRAARDTTTVRRRAAVLGLGVVVLAGLLVGCGIEVGRALWLVPVAAACLALWVLGSSAALASHAAGARAVAFVGIGLGTALTLGLAAGLGAPDWPAAAGGSALARWPVERTILVVGVLLVQLATANIVVRLLLDAVGVPAETGEKTLKGGRVLGPLERVFLVALGLGGAVAAAAVVVAAKGLLRFPELQRGGRAGPAT